MLPALLLCLMYVQTLAARVLENSLVSQVIMCLDRAPCKSIGNEKVTNKFISSSILLQLDYGSKN